MKSSATYRFDIIGLSMYTYWNGPISALKANMDDISRRYNKDVIVVESRLCLYLDNCDNAENSFRAKKKMVVIRPPSGDNIIIFDLMQAVADVPQHRGKGIFFIGSRRGLPCREMQATPAGMKYIHDEWKQGNARENPGAV